MKNRLFILLLLCSLLSRAQGPQQLVTVPYDTWPGASVNGWIYLPADYYTSTKNYPVVFFYHGVGEAGTNPYTLINQGLPNLIANGMRPDNITNPTDGQQYSFIVLSVQHWSWSPNPLWLPYELQWLKQNYRIDSDRVYITGLSAGGQAAFNVAIQNNAVSQLIAADVPMSPAGVWPYDPSLVGQNKIKTWFFSGNTDGSYTANATTYSNDCNNIFPGSSKLSLYSGGHCCWNNFYDVNWHDPLTGLSIWEWLLTNKRQPAQALPVNFINFNLNKTDEGIQLKWKVADEINVLKYEVEKSSNGKLFEKIGEVAASVQNEYAYTDIKPASKNFYRIKGVDADGKYQYTSVLNYNDGRSSVVLKVFPTPAQNELTIQHDIAVPGSKIFLRSGDGRELEEIAAETGKQQTHINLSRFKPGIYFISYRDAEGKVESIKFVKQ